MVLRTDSARAMTGAVGRGAWILERVSPAGFADDVHVGCDRRRGVKGDAHVWPESLNGDKSTERGETKQEHA